MKSDVDPYEVLNTHRDWTIYRCREGCVHLQMGKINLRFSADEFARLAKFVNDAHKRIDVKKTAGRVKREFLH